MKKTILTLIATLSFLTAETKYFCIPTYAHMFGASLVIDKGIVTANIFPKKKIIASNVGTGLFESKQLLLPGTQQYKTEKGVSMEWIPALNILMMDYQGLFNVEFKCKTMKEK